MNKNALLAAPLCAALVARRLGLYVGMDFAHSTVDNAFYIQVGNGWR